MPRFGEPSAPFGWDRGMRILAVPIKCERRPEVDVVVDVVVNVGWVRHAVCAVTHQNLFRHSGQARVAGASRNPGYDISGLPLPAFAGTSFSGTGFALIELYACMSFQRKGA